MPVRKPLELARQALHDKTLSAKTLAFKMVVQCRRAVQFATAEAIMSGRRDGVDTPGLEWYLFYMWWCFLDVAAAEDSRLSFFVDVLVAIRAKYDEDTEWIFRGKPFDWSNLDDQWPCWGMAIAEVMHTGQVPRDEDGNWIDPYDVKLGEPILAGDPPPDTHEGRGWARSRAHWLNHNTFRARLWALGIDADPYWAMHSVAMYLEPLSLPEDVWRSKPGSPTFPRELGMESGMIWLRVAGARMFMCRKVWGRDSVTATRVGRSGGTWKGVAGYHPDRWAHWKDILRALVGGEKGEWRPNIMEAAKSTLDAMEKAEVEARGLQS